ncbi:MAG: hypothetical protein N2Z21_00665, partial [Candidatus Sumerlaeaceae bacterium]|nr:hypothetical protein [Candidatus Sumerlaeaceae bacterium]
MNVLSTLRQWLYPPEFRIPPPVWPAVLADALRETAQAIEKMEEAGARSLGKAPEENAWHKILADVCTGLWRLRQRMLHPETGRPLEEMRKAYRHFEAVWDALKQAGIEICDHVGEPWVEGSGLEVIAFEPQPNINRTTVVEAIRPTICLDGRLLQVGQVIVGAPERLGPKA